MSKNDAWCLPRYLYLSMYLCIYLSIYKNTFLPSPFPGTQNTSLPYFPLSVHNYAFLFSSLVSLGHIPSFSALALVSENILSPLPTPPPPSTFANGIECPLPSIFTRIHRSARSMTLYIYDQSNAFCCLGVSFTSLIPKRPIPIKYPTRIIPGITMQQQKSPFMSKIKCRKRIIPTHNPPPDKKQKQNKNTPLSCQRLI